jgi:hypothetical protein
MKPRVIKFLGSGVWAVETAESLLPMPNFEMAMRWALACANTATKKISGLRQK